MIECEHHGIKFGLSRCPDCEQVVYSPLEFNSCHNREVKCGHDMSEHDTPGMSCYICNCDQFVPDGPITPPIPKKRREYS